MTSKPPPRQVASTSEARAPAGPDNARARALFDTTAAIANGRAGIDAISVYAEGGQAVAWAGRPSNLPDIRILGPEALFVAPGPAGLRLVHVRPITDTGKEGRRLGSIAAEHQLTRDSSTHPGQATFTLETSLVPVSLRPRYEGSDSTPPYGFLLSAPDGLPLLEAEVSPRSLADLRLAWRSRLADLLLALVAAVLLVLAVLVREAQEATRERAGYLGLTAGLVGLLLVARALLMIAVPPEWRLSTPTTALGQVVLRSAADHLFTALLLLALVVIAGDLVERWRLARHARRRRVANTPASQVAFWIVQAVTATTIGVGLILHEHVLSAIVRESGTVGLRFSLHPFEAERLTLLLGTCCLNAAAFWACVIAARLAATWWRSPPGHRGARRPGSRLHHDSARASRVGDQRTRAVRHAAPRAVRDRHRAGGRRVAMGRAPIPACLAGPATARGVRRPGASVARALPGDDGARGRGAQ